MLARLLGAAFGGKATVAGGVLLLAGALITGTAPNTDAPADAEVPVPAVAAILSQAPTPTPTRVPEPPQKAELAPAPTPASTICVVDPQARDGALRSLRTTFAASSSALDRLGSERNGSRATQALDHADAMLANVDRTSEDLVASARCAADVREVTERATHAMDMIVDLAKSAIAPTPTPRPPARPAAKPKETRRPH